MWVPLGSLHVSTKGKVLCRCQCGRESNVIVRDVLAGKSGSCKSCSMRLRMKMVTQEERIVRAKKASAAAVEKLSLRINPYETKYGIAQIKQLAHIFSSAKQRCSNPSALSFYNYGGRGIAFRFPSIRAAVEWVLDNLGDKPTPLHSLDRVDNDRHYEPGNLRWATRTEQARNKRAYKRTLNGERIRVIKTLRADLSYETIRQWIIQGATNEEIITRRKYACTSL